MSLCLLPIEILVSIFGELGYGSDPVEYHRTASRSLKSLRLTSRYIGALATELLFQRCALVVGDTESWLRIYEIANHQEIAKYLKVLNIVDLDAWIGSPGLWITGAFDLAMLSEINSITIFNTLRASRSPAKIKIRAEPCPLEVDAPLMTGWLEDFLQEFIEVTPRQGFQIVALEFSFPHERTWDWVSPSINLEYLQSLNLTLRSLGDPDDVEKLQTSLVPAIKNMPALKSFNLKQRTRCNPAYTSDMNVNIIGMLWNKNWPRLSHLEIRCTQTSLVELQAFLLANGRSLQTFHLCVTPKGYLEMEEGHIDEKDLPVLKDWIELAGIVPGGLTMFTGKPDEEQEEAWPKI